MSPIEMRAVYLTGVVWLVSLVVRSYSYPSMYSDLDHCLLLTQEGTVIAESQLHDGCSGKLFDVCEKSTPLSQQHGSCASILSTIEKIYYDEPLVELASARDIVDGDWLSDTHGKISSRSAQPNCSVIVFPPAVIDRECLMTPLPSHPPQPPNILTVTTNTDTQSIVDYVNQHCHTFRAVDGDLDQRGLHEEYIKQNLYSVSDIEGKIKSENAFASLSKSSEPMPECERMEITSWTQFFTEYLQLSKPVIITNVMDTWDATSKWTNEFLKTKYGNKSVHIKLSPSTDYEGIEDAELWESKNKNFKIPDSVFAKLKFPDLVVPRPAPASMQFGDYIDLMESIGNGSITNASAYLEYSSIPNYFPDLREDITEMPFVEGQLELRHTNIWLSDGHTLGKLHFDPFDNFLCMIDGWKELILFEPHKNEMMYEAHIPEAQFSVDLKTLQFRRNDLLESTSMVMSPFDIKRPNFERFPKFRQTMPLNCTINEGEVLFMPAFWWHEVQSSPNPLTNRNLAINFWYEPFLTKNFPCPECKLKINPKYFHLL